MALFRKVPKEEKEAALAAKQAAKEAKKQDKGYKRIEMPTDDETMYNPITHIPPQTVQPQSVVPPPVAPTPVEAAQPYQQPQPVPQQPVQEISQPAPQPIEAKPIEEPIQEEEAKSVWTVEEVPTQTQTVIVNNNTKKAYSIADALVEILNAIEG